ncbi:response regulator [Agrobacterium vitis]|uniref:HD domain-containing phosphohydrolase n=1 Tax=Agrobacterium vitis TaxID=373 RepID=UPI000872AF84|nr:HD domain-containing phosphohydrolase [Agrobacterium vitis]MCE6076229.1 response regulator [Agrobacterium vitis]MCM2448830.1 response regulator [Agrobacterium vitis]MCM2469923.1 response regulator [Agrobacterium vitis]MUO69790.1 response regulator [Agrobacterium vitis]MUO82927.1 response regulator [Agrobacterium vitis]
MHAVVIDDSRSTLLALRLELLEITGLEVETFADPEEAIRVCETRQFDLVLVDYNMPKRSGIEVITALRAMPNYELVPILMITSETETAVCLNALEAGATDFLRKSADPVELKARARNLLSLRRAQVELSLRADGLAAAVTAKSAALVASEEELIWRLARAMEYRDGETGDHVSRVAQISRLLAQDLGLDEDRQRKIYLAAPLHDVGKIGIPDGVLSKPGRLTDSERDMMRRHVDIGVKILENGTSDLLRVAERIAGGHHEKWDGTGYPKGLSGREIPLEARIVALADVFDALCSPRAYKPAWSLQDALDHIRREKGRHFDPACVEAFERQWSKIASVMGADETDMRIHVDGAPSLDTAYPENALRLQKQTKYRSTRQPAGRE